MKDTVTMLVEALGELLIDMKIAQTNMRAAAKRDPAWEGCAEAIQPRVDAAEAALSAAKGGGWMPLESAPFSDVLGPNQNRLMLWVKGFGLAFGKIYKVPGESPHVSIENLLGNCEIVGWQPLPPPPKD